MVERARHQPHLIRADHPVISHRRFQHHAVSIGVALNRRFRLDRRLGLVLRRRRICTTARSVAGAGRRIFCRCILAGCPARWEHRLSGAGLCLALIVAFALHGGRRQQMRGGAVADHALQAEDARAGAAQRCGDSGRIALGGAISRRTTPL